MNAARRCRVDAPRSPATAPTRSRPAPSARPARRRSPVHDLVRHRARDRACSGSSSRRRRGTLNVPERPDLHRHLGRLHAEPRLGRPRQVHLHGPELVERLPPLPGARGGHPERGRRVPERVDLGSARDHVQPARARGCSRPCWRTTRRWTGRVDGVSGGSPVTGTVDATGLYVAPAVAPPGGQVTIRATSGSGRLRRGDDPVVDPPPPQPAPSVAAVGGLRRSRSRATGRSLPDAGRSFRDTRLHDGGRRRGRDHEARARTGIARVRVRGGDRLLGRCRVRATKGRAFTCRVPLPGDVCARRACAS